MLHRVAAGALGAEEAARALEQHYFEDVGYARVDHHRLERLGFPETVFAPGKSSSEVIGIAGKILERAGRAFVTRLNAEQMEALAGRFASQPVRMNERAGTFLLGEHTAEATVRTLVISAGTSDAAVAEEAWETLYAFGYEVPRVYDAGVAGLHRLLAEKERIRKAEVVVVVAGMEGALPSVVGGLAGCLVIGVPTSVGYGACFGGVAALLAMLNSCCPNVVTVNIDDGFGGGFAAGLVLKRTFES